MTAGVKWWVGATLADIHAHPDRWEALCDGCGRCCTERYDEGGGVQAMTDIACKLLNCRTARCSDYRNRHTREPRCLPITPAEVAREDGDWLPPTCAYRLIHKGRDLFFWHHLMNGGDRQMVHRIGPGVAGKVQPPRRGINSARRIVERVKAV
jgi:uncharacterized cysteine cluster protein YcgN (CxxCxxCC family)